MSLEDALTIVQAGLTAFGVVLIVVFARQQIRKSRRPRPTPTQMVNKHDEICTVGPWPHAGFCVPNGGPGVMGRMLLLVMLADENIGRVDDITTLRIDRDTMAVVEIEKREDEKCEGQD